MSTSTNTIPQTADKVWAPVLILLVAKIVREVWGVDLGIDEVMAAEIAAALAVISTYFVRNTPIVPVYVETAPGSGYRVVPSSGVWSHWMPWAAAGVGLALVAGYALRLGGVI